MNIGPTHVPEIIERATLWPRFVVRSASRPTACWQAWWVRDTCVPHLSMSRTYEAREDAQAVADWLTERAAGYPRNQAMDVWPEDRWTGCGILPAHIYAQPYLFWV